MKVRRADVVLVDYLFSDRTGSKLRPCLVVQNDGDNLRLDDTIVVAISSNTVRASNRATQVVITVANPEGRQTGLLFDSAIQCENIVTVDCQFVLRKVGSVSALIMADVDLALKVALELK
jgi:mRNA interferase MazF